MIFDPLFHILSVEVYHDEYIFVVFNSSSRNIDYISILKSKTATEAESFAKEICQGNNLRDHFRRINVIINDNRNTLVPDPFFEKDHMDTLASLNFSTDKNEALKFLNILPIKSKIIFPLKANTLFSNLENTNVHYIFGGAILIETVLQLNKFSEKRKKTYVYSENNLLEVIIIEGQDLLFYNTFVYQEIEDMVYYLLNIYDVFKLSPSQVPLQWIGVKPAPHSKEYGIINKYLIVGEELSVAADLLPSVQTDHSILNKLYKALQINLCEL